MNINNKLLHVTILFLSIIFIIAGNRFATRGLELNFTGSANSDHDHYNPQAFYTAAITHIIERTEDDSFGFSSVHIMFDARITSGYRRGESVIASQFLMDFFVVSDRYVEVGDRVLLMHDEHIDGYFFADFVRTNAILVLGAIFLVLVVVFARLRGLNAIIALVLTCLAVFLVFIPAILSGRNIYIVTIIVCLFSIISTLLIVIGPNKKAWSAMLGCLGGVALAGVLMWAITPVLNLTGAIDQESQALLLLPTQNPINLRAIIFAGVILGAVGAIMDVAMSISSSLWEVREATKGASFGSLFKSGINIGKDVLGTMLNTLILAYIGSSLSLILVIIVHSPSHLQLLNMELIAVEFIRALIGAFGMFLTIPLTALVCGWLYSGDDEKRPPRAEQLRGSKRLYEPEIDN